MIAMTMRKGAGALLLFALLAAGAVGCGDGRADSALVGPMETKAGDVTLALEILPSPPVSKKDLTFRLTLTDARARPVTDAGVALSLFMPEMDHGENVIRLRHVGGGVYEGKGLLVMAGRWAAEVSVARMGERRRGRVEFRVPR